MERKRENKKTMKYFFTSDEHYGHANIIKYCSRPFGNVEEMNEELIKKHNEVVGKDDITIHAGDFTLGKKDFAENIIRRLNGKHIFIKGSHDYWNDKLPYMWEGEVEGVYIVACHYALRVWPKSHYGSISVYGHSHGKLPPIKNSWDVGVDNNDYRPISFEELIKKLN